MPLTQVSPGLLDPIAQYYGFKNRLINGAVAINQRNGGAAVTVTTSTSGTFGPDRFYGYTGTGSLWQTQRVSTGNLDFPFANRIQRIAGQTSTSAIFWRQIIETNNCSDLAGQTVTFSFFATAGANYSGGAVTVSVFSGNAADQGTVSLNTGAWTSLASVVNSTFTPTTTRTRYTFTGTVGASAQEIAVGLNWSGSGTAGANDFIDITGIQLEEGSTATSFDYRPYGTELALCQRYFYKTYNTDVAVGTNTSDGTIYLETLASGDLNRLKSFNPRLPVSMRIAPTVSAYSQTGTIDRINVYANSASTLTVSSVANTGTTSFFNYLQTTTNAVAAQTYACHLTASAEL
jgi:hypothetical protein